jgi:catalase
MAERKLLTAESGAPVEDNQNSKTAGPAAPVLMRDHHLIEKLARLAREKIPERIVHARGSAGSVRDPRGFAVKFNTEEGKWDN